MNSLTNAARRVKRVVMRAMGRELHYTNQLQCRTVRLGTEYGGWTICPDRIDANSIIYSVGLGTDISFDLEMIARYGVTIYGFDPTPGSIQWVKSQALPPQFRLQEYGIADYDGTATFYPPVNPNEISHTLTDRPETADRKIVVPVYTLKTILQNLNHDHIDILKMDVEGAEYSVLDDILANDISIGQLLVEFHHRWESIGLPRTREAIRKLNDHGYRIFDSTPNGQEYSLMKA